MDRETYLSRLQTALRKKCPEQQVRDILSDYKDFFTTGTAEGKSETELCAEFGTPEQAALELEKESAGGARLHKGNWSVFVIALLVILIAVILWPFFIPKIQVACTSVPQAPVNFWLTMLFPLALESILVLWASQSNPPKKALNWIPRVVIIFSALSAAVLALLVFFVFWIPQSAKSFETEGLFGTTHILTAVVSCGTVISEILLLISAVLLMLWAMRGHEKVHWFLFLDTTLLTLFLNFTSFLSSISADSTSNPYSAIIGVASCFLWAVLPNLTAAAIWWVIEKVFAVRRAKA